MIAKGMIRAGLFLGPYVAALVLLCAPPAPPAAAAEDGGAAGVPATRPAGGAAAATEPAPDETPVQALVRGWRVSDACDVKRSMELYDYGQREQPLVQAMCTAAAAGTRVELAMRRKFGDAAAAEMVHAIGQSVEADVARARATIEGDSATVVIPNTGHVIPMVRVNGVWKMAMKDQGAAMTNAEINAAFETRMAEAVGFRKVAARLEAGELTTAEQVTEAMVQAAHPPPPPPGGGPV